MHLHLSLSDMFLIVDNQFKSMEQATWAMDSAHSEDTTHRTDSTTATQKQDRINKISSEEKWFMWHSQIHRGFKRASIPGCRVVP